MESFERQSNGIMRTETSNKQTMVVKEYSYEGVMRIWEQESGSERGTQRG